MKVVFGMRDMATPLLVDVNEDTESLLDRTKTAIAAGTVLELTDSKGDQLLVNGSTVAFIQVSSEQNHKVGFGRP